MSIGQVSKSSVLIAGAGIGGLAMALSLLHRGIDCDVFEQASELREVGSEAFGSPRTECAFFKVLA